MTDIVTWLGDLFSMPQLSFFKYIIAAILLLVFIDAFLSFILAGIHTLVSGGKK